MSAIMLMQGDCLERMSRIGNGSIDMTVTSPPYDDMRTYNGNNSQWSDSVWRSVILELYRVTNAGGVVVWVVGDRTVKGSETCTSFAQALFAKECGFNVETMIWEKTGSGCLGSNKYYGQNFEYMFVFAKGQPKTTNLIKDRENVVKAGKVKVNGGVDNEGKSKARVIERKPFGKRSNIWRFDPQKNSDHPAPFPLNLAYDHVRSWSEEGDVVLDPFMGSGTTGVACKSLNRNFIGIELDQKYFEIARSRIDEA